MIYNMLTTLGGGGGGGKGADVNVITIASGLTLPATAKENTIAVITDTAMTFYTFSSEAPESPQEGDIWFTTGTSSKVKFNMSDKNGIWIYPSSCKQYISNAWTAKSVSSYQNGEWINWWDGWIYNYGVEDSNAGQINLYYNRGTVTKNTASISFDQTGGGSEGIIYIYTDKKVNVSAFSTLSVTTSITRNAKVSCDIRLTNTAPYNGEYVASAGWGNGTSTLDISSLTGEYYVALHSSMAAAWDNAYLTGSITTIRLQ